MKIGWIGTGVMGASMSRRLLEAGYELAVYNRSAEKARPLWDAGAGRAESPAEAADGRDLVFSIVGYPSDVEEVYLGPNGVLSALRPGTICVDMTTSRPSLARQISEQAATRDIRVLDAPVSGGDIGAREGRLAIMVGGDQSAFDRVVPVLKHLGPAPRLMGPAGSGQHTKMANQILIASTMMGVCESLVYAAGCGLDPDAVIDVIGSGAASSWSINNLGRRIVAGDFDPGFYVRHFIKDLGIALDEAARLKLALPGLALADQLYKSVAAGGMDLLGTQALYKVIAGLSGL